MTIFKAGTVLKPIRKNIIFKLDMLLLNFTEARSQGTNDNSTCEGRKVINKYDNNKNEKETIFMGFEISLSPYMFFHAIVVGDGTATVNAENGERVSEGS